MVGRIGVLAPAQLAIKTQAYIPRAVEGQIAREAQQAVANRTVSRDVAEDPQLGVENAPARRAGLDYCALELRVEQLVLRRHRDPPRLTKDRDRVSVVAGRLQERERVRGWHPVLALV